VGKCHYFLATDGSQKFEFCAFRSVRQILLSNYRSVVTGHWKGWKTEEKDGKQLMIQEYENGDECPGFGKRYTLVEYTVRALALFSGPVARSPFCLPPPPHTHTHTHRVQCKKEAKGLELVSIAEYDVCKYRMILALPQWCNVKG
jgi:hypothetical protein